MEPPHRPTTPNLEPRFSQTDAYRTPTKTKIHGAIEFCLAKGILRSKQEVFDFFGVGRTQGYTILNNKNTNRRLQHSYIAELARSGLVVIFLSEGMDSQMMRQRMPKQHPMLVSSNGFSKRYSHHGIQSILSKEFGNQLMESTAVFRSLREPKGGKSININVS